MPSQVRRETCVPSGLLSQILLGVVRLFSCNFLSCCKGGLTGPSKQKTFRVESNRKESSRPLSALEAVQSRVAGLGRSSESRELCGIQLAKGVPLLHRLRSLLTFVASLTVVAESVAAVCHHFSSTAKTTKLFSDAIQMAGCNGFLGIHFIFNVHHRLRI